MCALCNESTEFLHRLDVKWVDVVHLSIFNLTLQDSKTYFEYEDTITQWINDNWDQLQAPLGVRRRDTARQNRWCIETTSKLRIIKEILQTLTWGVYV